jgi:type III pantothenate kinase
VQDFATANLLVLEIGNSHIALASVIDDEVRLTQRMGLDEMSELEAALEPAWESLPEGRGRAVVVGSVVPTLLDRVLSSVRDELHTDARFVGRDLRLPMSLALEHPERVGVDRVCAAAAAYERYARACAVASFGTATTIDCVNDEGVFLGGAILPGLQMQARALHEGTAQLPLAHVEAPRATYGGTTEEAIQVGVACGAVGALREIVERYATDLKRWPQLVLTGGSSSMIADMCDFADAVIPDLCIRGIALAHRRHFASMASDE